MTLLIKPQVGLILFLGILVSCTSNETALPGYSGNTGEVIVVMPQNYWNSVSGDTLKGYLEQSQYGLPQDEPVFKIIHVSPHDFAKIFQTHRNILIIDISKNYKEVKSEIKMNSWSKGQSLIKMMAPSEEALVHFLSKHAGNIINHFNSKEIERLMDKNSKHGFVKDFDTGKNLTLSMALEKDIYVAGQDSNFIWLRLEKGRPLGGYEHQVSKGILLYWYHYNDTSQMNPARLLAVKDSIGKKFVPGSLENSYMVASYKLMPPQASINRFKTNDQLKEKEFYSVELRGLWRMENDFMGGPFISLTLLDEQRGLIITAEGYIFAPQFDKLNYLREVEAMIKSIELK